jgi:hypothetical protein
MRIRILIFALLAFKMPTKKMTNGSESGSRRPKNMWIRWIRIRIRNIALKKGIRSGVGSGSSSQRCGSADPNPHQKVTDPQHKKRGKRFILEDFLKETRSKGYLSGPGVHDVNQTMNSLPRK